MVVSNEVSKIILKNAISQNKISHAYLFEMDSSLENNELIFSFVKNIICPFDKDKKNCNSCNICRRIDSGNYPDLRIINPDGLFIKKDQLLKLQGDFNKKSIESKHMVYIINEAEKMNVSASNTILKFLEEPEEGIIAILITNNVNNILKTIVSRCQIISLKNKDKLECCYNDDDIKKVIDFVSILEKNKIATISKVDELWNSKFKSRDEMIRAFDILLLIYTDILHYMISNNWEMFEKYKNMLGNIFDNNTKNTIYKKLNIIIDINDNLKYNTNTNLLMDKFIIEFSGVD